MFLTYSITAGISHIYPARFQQKLRTVYGDDIVISSF